MPVGATEYDRERAVSYAHKWAYSRNPDFYNFEHIGGDCTNFASQCIYAGSNIMNYAKTTGWYYRNANDKSPSWTGVPFLKDFLVKNKTGLGPYAKEVPIEEIMPGDILQLSFDGILFRHTPIVVETGSIPNANNILIAAHSYDADYRPLHTYTYKKIRFLHILWVRLH